MVLDSLAVRLADTVRVVSPDEGWSIANKIAVVAIGVTLLFSFAVLTLQVRQVLLEKKAKSQRTGAVDRRIGWLAFRLARQLRSWLDEPIPNTGGIKVGDLAEQLRAKDLANGFRIVHWASARMAKDHSGPAEELVNEIMGAASGASDAVELVANDAFKHFYQAVGDLSAALVQVREDKLEEARRLFLNGYDALRTCADQVTELVPLKLRGQIIFMWGTVALHVAVDGVGVFTPAPAKPDDHASGTRGDP